MCDPFIIMCHIQCKIKGILVFEKHILNAVTAISIACLKSKGVNSMKLYLRKKLALILFV